MSAESTGMPLGKWLFGNLRIPMLETEIVMQCDVLEEEG